jgi:hypothetical protein
VWLEIKRRPTNDDALARHFERKPRAWTVFVMTARELRAAPTWARIIAVIALVSVAAFFVTMHVTNQQEDSLLQNDTAQAAAVTSSMFSNTLSTLDSLRTTVTATNGSTSAFLAQAQPIVHEPLSVALAKEYLAHYVIFAAVGGTFRTGQLLNDMVAAALHSADTAPRPVPVLTLGGRGVADFAVGPPFVPSGDLIYLQSDVSQFMASHLTTAPAFSNLRIALYGSSRPAVANLIASTSRELPLLGPVASAPVLVGDSTWTLVAEARSPLVGGFADNAPLIVLLLGLFVAIACGLTFERLSQRRKPRGAGTDPGDGIIVTQFAPPPQLETVPEPRQPVPLEEPPRPVPVAEPRPVSSEEQPPFPPDAVEQGAARLSDPVVLTPLQNEPAQPIEPPPPVYADWRPDPFGRFELRRFFLGRPTSVVKSGNNEAYDPVTDPLAPQIDREPEASASAPTELERPRPQEPQADDSGVVDEQPGRDGEEPAEALTDDERPSPSEDPVRDAPTDDSDVVDEQPGRDEEEPAEALTDDERPAPSEDPVRDAPTGASAAPPDDIQEALEMLATRVARTVAEEIEELNASASDLIDTTGASEDPGVSPPSAAPRITPSPPPVNYTHPARKHEPAKVLAAAGGLLGAVSLLRRRLRKPPRAD